ncbi:glycosyltransferase [Lederbergia citrea]|uniref:Glycosyltransferase n=1 Tax=Lederbergia citrea TaxID=2833581 RepID=A0A942UJZ4_9BACI|nr:glycosyltransferase [Lederbergia citrea]MBS4176688.1 glycosyltransferase [Lederbergia citrea]MBS4203249.1 glycosyltransferase [Lederbergia citrea]MBS4222080.1 glycosyltransferase [Lederbergia citrea]
MVSLVACTIRDNMMENIFENFERQEWGKKELIIILNKDDMEIEMWKERSKDKDNVSIYQLPEEKSLGECLNFGIEISQYNIVAKLDDDDYYSPYYLTEAMEVFTTTDAQLVGKGKSFMYFEKEQLLTIRNIGSENLAGSSSLKGGTLIFKKEIYPNNKFPSIVGNGTDSKFVRACKRSKIKIHTTSRYNYVYIRRANNNSHTYKRSNKTLKQKSQIIGKVENYVPVITKDFGNNSKS